jgi:phenylacetate-CoA ligase
VRPLPSYYTEEDGSIRELRAQGVGARERHLLVRIRDDGLISPASAWSRGAVVRRQWSLACVRPVVRVLRDLGVTLTWSMPTETFLWVAAARAAGMEPGRDFPALRALFVGGEPLSPARRRRMTDIWGVPVVEEYGSTETGSLAGQCPHGELHLWADRAIFEVHDPATGSTTSDGRGQLVVTPLYREAMPLLRYNLEDDVEISAAPCRAAGCRPCGYDAPASSWNSAADGDRPTQELVFKLPAS